jgi:hypothetical protein
VRFRSFRLWNPWASAEVEVALVAEAVEAAVAAGAVEVVSQELPLLICNDWLPPEKLAQSEGKKVLKSQIIQLFLKNIL